MAAEQGLAGAQFILGLMYDSGRGVPEDDAEAVKWFRMAAQQGYANGNTSWAACTPTARVCTKTMPKPSSGTAWPPSRGTPRHNTGWVSCTPAARVCTKTMPKRSSGSAWPQSRGTPRRNSSWASVTPPAEGVPKDDAEAVKWFRMATEQGHAGAQFNLGVMYASGEGVPEDYVRAYAWYNLAAAQGLEPAVKAKESLRERMTPKQIARAQELSNTFFQRVREKADLRTD